MSWVSIVFFMLTHLPQFISLIHEFINVIHGKPAVEQRVAQDAMQDAIEYFKETGDASKIISVIKTHGSPAMADSVIPSPAELVGA